MRSFKYKGFNKVGDKASGVVNAENKSHALVKLDNQNIYVKSLSLMFFVKTKVDVDELTQFFLHFLFQVKCSVPILRALETYSIMSMNVTIKHSLENICDYLRNGVNLYMSFKNEKKVFGVVIPALLQSAEKSGMLEESLESIITYLRFEKNIRSKLQRALYYPMFVLLVSFIVFLFCMLFLAPQVKSLVKEIIQGDLPYITRICFSFIPDTPSTVLTIFSMVFLMIAMTYKFKNTRKIMNRMILHAPLVGNLLKMIYEWHLCTIFNITLQAKLNILHIANLLVSSFRDSIFEDSIAKLNSKLLDGDTLTSSLTVLGFMQDSSLLAIKVGEESNNLPQSFRHITDLQSEEIQYNIKKLGIKMGTYATFLSGGLLMFVLFGLLYPLYSYIDFIPQ